MPNRLPISYLTSQYLYDKELFTIQNPSNKKRDKYS